MQRIKRIAKRLYRYILDASRTDAAAHEAAVKAALKSKNPNLFVSLTRFNQH